MSDIPFDEESLHASKEEINMDLLSLQSTSETKLSSPLHLDRTTKYANVGVVSIHSSLDPHPFDESHEEPPTEDIVPCDNQSQAEEETSVHTTTRSDRTTPETLTDDNEPSHLKTVTKKLTRDESDADEKSSLTNFKSCISKVTPDDTLENVINAHVATETTNLSFSEESNNSSKNESMCDLFTIVRESSTCLQEESNVISCSSSVSEESNHVKEIDQSNTLTTDAGSISTPRDIDALQELSAHHQIPIVNKVRDSATKDEQPSENEILCVLNDKNSVDSGSVSEESSNNLVKELRLSNSLNISSLQDDAHEIPIVNAVRHYSPTKDEQQQQQIEVTTDEENSNYNDTTGNSNVVFITNDDLVTYTTTTNTTTDKDITVEPSLSDDDVDTDESQYVTKDRSSHVGVDGRRTAADSGDQSAMAAAAAPMMLETSTGTYDTIDLSKSKENNTITENLAEQQKLDNDNIQHVTDDEKDVYQIPSSKNNNQVMDSLFLSLDEVDHSSITTYESNNAYSIPPCHSVGYNKHYVVSSDCDDNSISEMSDSLLLNKSANRPSAGAKTRQFFHKKESDCSSFVTDESSSTRSRSSCSSSESSDDDDNNNKIILSYNFHHSNISTVTSLPQKSEEAAASSYNNIPNVPKENLSLHNINQVEQQQCAVATDDHAWRNSSSSAAVLGNTITCPKNTIPIDKLLERDDGDEKMKNQRLPPTLPLGNDNSLTSYYMEESMDVVDQSSQMNQSVEGEMKSTKETNYYSQTITASIGANNIASCNGKRLVPIQEKEYSEEEQQPIPQFHIPPTAAVERYNDYVTDNFPDESSYTTYESYSSISSCLHDKALLNHTFATSQQSLVHGSSSLSSSCCSSASYTSLADNGSDASSLSLQTSDYDDGSTTYYETRVIKKEECRRSFFAFTHDHNENSHGMTSWPSSARQRQRQQQHHPRSATTGEEYDSITTPLFIEDSLSAIPLLNDSSGNYHSPEPSLVDTDDSNDSFSSAARNNNNNNNKSRSFDFSPYMQTTQTHHHRPVEIDFATLPFLWGSSTTNTSSNNGNNDDAAEVAAAAAAAIKNKIDKYHHHSSIISSSSCNCDDSSSLESLPFTYTLSTKSDDDDDDDDDDDESELQYMKFCDRDSWCQEDKDEEENDSMMENGTQTHYLTQFSHTEFNILKTAYLNKIEAERNLDARTANRLTNDPNYDLDYDDDDGTNGDDCNVTFLHHNGRSGGDLQTEIDETDKQQLLNDSGSTMMTMTQQRRDESGTTEEEDDIDTFLSGARDAAPAPLTMTSLRNIIPTDIVNNSLSISGVDESRDETTVLSCMLDFFETYVPCFFMPTTNEMYYEPLTTTTTTTTTTKPRKAMQIGPSTSRHSSPKTTTTTTTTTSSSSSLEEIDRQLTLMRRHMKKMYNTSKEDMKSCVYDMNKSCELICNDFYEFCQGRSGSNDAGSKSSLSNGNRKYYTRL